MLNISKKRYFPEWEYFVYYLTKKERGNYLNVWFPGKDFINKQKKRYSTNEYWTIKKCDHDTSNHLYGRVYNPISISIMTSYRFIRKESLFPFNMKAMIHSIDDSSYGIWFEDMELADLEAKRLQIMKYVDYVKVLSGKEFLEYCVMIGGDPKSIDYN